MREYLTPGSIASTIRLLRTTFTGSFLIVEGDSDARLFKRFVDFTQCNIVLGYNRDNVLKVATILFSDGFLGFLALVDSDFSELIGETLDNYNIILTDSNDVEVMIFNTDVFDRFVAEYCSSDKIAAVENNLSLTIREIIMRNACVIGALRYLSRILSWNLDFQNMKYKYVERVSLNISLDEQIEHLRGRSGTTSMPGVEEVREKVAETITSLTTVSLCVCGHDLCEIVSHAVHNVIGRAHHLSRSGAAVEEVFRAAYTQDNFRQSKVHRDIVAWEDRNGAFKVLLRRSSRGPQAV